MIAKLKKKYIFFTCGHDKIALRNFVPTQYIFVRHNNARAKFYKICRNHLYLISIKYTQLHRISACACKNIFYSLIFVL